MITGYTSEINAARKAHAYEVERYETALADMRAVSPVFDSFVVDPQHNDRHPIAGLMGRVGDAPALVWRTTLGTWSAYVGTGSSKRRAHGNTPTALAHAFVAAITVAS